MFRPPHRATRPSASAGPASIVAAAIQRRARPDHRERRASPGILTNWVQGATTVSFGANITVNSFTVNSTTSATASITIGPQATVGVRNVTLTTGAEIATLTSGFTQSTQRRGRLRSPFTSRRTAAIPGAAHWPRPIPRTPTAPLRVSTMRARPSNPSLKPDGAR